MYQLFLPPGDFTRDYWDEREQRHTMSVRAYIHSYKYENNKKSSSHQYLVVELDYPIETNNLTAPIRTCQASDVPDGEHLSLRFIFLTDKLQVIIRSVNSFCWGKFSYFCVHSFPIPNFKANSVLSQGLIQDRFCTEFVWVRANSVIHSLLSSDSNE